MIGIIGFGTVGRAYAMAFRLRGLEPVIYDISNEKMREAEHLGFETGTLSRVVSISDYILICVPTPIGESEPLDTSRVRQCVSEIASIDKDARIVIKSTMPPLGCRKIIRETGVKNLIYSPEFLRERTALHDAMYPDRIILAGDDRRLLDEAEKYLYGSWKPKPPVIKTSYEVAEVVKLFTNAFLAAKVSFSNIIWLACRKLGINPEEVYAIFTLDPRISPSHLRPTGEAFGGKCLPKDLRAVVSYLATSKRFEDDFLEESAVRFLESVLLINDSVKRIRKRTRNDKGVRCSGPLPG